MTLAALKEDFAPVVGLSVEEKERYANENYGLIHFVANRFTNTGYRYDDLLSAAQLGFVKALNTFNPHKGIKFATYSTRCMHNEILMFLRKEKKHANLLSIDYAVFKGEDGSEIALIDILPAETEEKTDWVELNEIINSVLKKCSPVEKQVFRLTTEGKPQREIAAVVNFSQSYASRIQKRVIKKMKTTYWRAQR